MEKREPWEKKSTFSALSVYQRILLLLLLVMIAGFTGLAFWFQSHPGLVCIGLEGKKALLVQSQAGETVRYSGKLDGQMAEFSVTGDTVRSTVVLSRSTLRPGGPLAQRPDRGGGAPGGHGGLSGRLCLPRPDAERLLGQKSGVGGRYRL